MCKSARRLPEGLGELNETAARTPARQRWCHGMEEVCRCRCAICYSVLVWKQQREEVTDMGDTDGGPSCPSCGFNHNVESKRKLYDLLIVVGWIGFVYMIETSLRLAQK